MDLSSMTNNQFNAAWEYSRAFYPRAVLLEDFDSVFHGRQNVSTEGRLDFSAVLNAIDGIEQEQGMLLFVTTNHPENIDPALGQPLPDGKTTRPGRLDVSIEIPPLDYDGRLKIALRIVDDFIDATKLVQEGSEDTPAQFIERCKQFALTSLWENDLTTATKDAKMSESPPVMPREDSQPEPYDEVTISGEPLATDPPPPE
jgi:SpoVK/Ycf46/Vps4 family AAA+-type ATPase